MDVPHTARPSYRNPCPDGVEIDIGQTVDQGLAVIGMNYEKVLTNSEQRVRKSL